MHLSRNWDTIQLLKSDCGTVKLDSISFPLCSDYTCIRKPVSLPVQLEIGRIQKIKLAKNCPILGIILHFREVAWLSHCLSFRFSFHSWDQLFTGHISTGPLMALLHKLNARIFHICVCVCVCVCVYVCIQRRQWHPTPVLLPGKSHGWRSLVGCAPWGC